MRNKAFEIVNTRIVTRLLALSQHLIAAGSALGCCWVSTRLLLGQHSVAAE